ncbi:MAG: hypothetical protein NXI01_00265 [Gammaproteobacteria bacterium]|nr:hypothetical protein [Gammaproteobacteria bacterium]
MPMLGPFYIQYPDMTTAGEWSDWYLCEIEVGADRNILQIDLKNTDVQLTAADIKKLRVFDPSLSSESDQTFCLGIHENILYKFSYTKLPFEEQHSCIAGLPLIIKTTRGPITSSGSIKNESTISWTQNDRLSVDKFYDGQTDNRLQFNQAEYEFLRTLTLGDMPSEHAVPAVDALPAAKSDVNEAWQAAKFENTLSPTVVATNLTEVQQSLIMACPLWHYIYELKKLSRSQDEYCQLLVQAYNRRTPWMLEEDMTENAKQNLDLFHKELGERILRDLDLDLFRDASAGNQPSRNDVQNYILAVIANELQSYNASSTLFSGIRLEKPKPITTWDEPMKIAATSQDLARLNEEFYSIMDDNTDYLQFDDPKEDTRLARLLSMQKALKTGDPTHPINAGRRAIVVPKEPKDPIQELIDKLSRTISLIDSNTHQAIFEYATTICTNLQSLPRTTQSQKNNITRALELTNELLQSQPGSGRTEIIRQYKELAIEFTRFRDYYWNLTGYRLMRLAAFFVGLGAVCVLVSSGGLPVAVTAAGLAFSGGTLPWAFTITSAISGLVGFGLYKAHPLSPATDSMQKMAEKIENETDCVIPGATAG